jgi:hypothetical protein
LIFIFFAHWFIYKKGGIYMLRIILPFALSFLSFLSYAREVNIDKGFRYNHAKRICANKDGIEGRSLMFFGVCGDLTNVRLTTFNFQGALMMGADISKDTNEEDWQELVKFDFADLRGFQAKNVLFMRTSFRGANLSYANFTKASFEPRGEADRIENVVNFSSANLSYANFRNAKFYFANLTNANLAGADLRGAIIEFSKLDGAIFDQYTKLPFSHNVALGFGMIYIETKETPHYKNIFEPNFPNYKLPNFNLGSCGISGDSLNERIENCKRLYKDQSIRKVLRTFGEKTWNLIAYNDSNSFSLWYDLEQGMVWSEESENPLTLQEAKIFCANLNKNFNGFPKFFLPSRDDFNMGARNGLTQAIPPMLRTHGFFWTSNARGSNNYFYYVFSSENSITSFMQWYNTPLRTVCVSSDTRFS